MLRLVVGQEDYFEIPSTLIDYLRENKVYFEVVFDTLYDGYPEIEYNGKRIKVDSSSDIEALVKRLVADTKDTVNDTDKSFPKSYKWDRILSSGALV
ncbi:hypothetical protein [Sulfolobus acidocaldarius]|uniref:Uncharacterized protein n=4 Tax=Sulfolobus acidocaldarius TaxID=2285 RepID=Q4JAR0_SULAC|nr:hypothetical protein [Sulfolobus acidocaldarius]AAY80119.1 hypothetical protein Saci_0743 [Sulfolobus acidocaldarius DSM 639]AGE70694.1 hypothetical protein SacN8_03610 [Sulfolobus acidocaldarius N8]AGE72966.1 hypothetical protein SacRon12I_03595 [Sulfolobus acidocaldarius Ron12/I]ALU28966.1 hypothetical protein ATY89_02695 [Sulfolobus acidocaldarius]ALU31693.1 hypothetical protein ATZ20_05720 [Sulfolobus acidocaldarius]